MRTGTIQKWLGLYIIFLSQLHLIISAPREENPDEWESEFQDDIKNPHRCRNASRKGNPDEWGSEFQDDIKIPHKDRDLLTYQERRWPDGIVPYKFGRIFAENKKPVVLKAMETYHNLTDNCIQFVERTNETDGVVFVERNDYCSSDIGKIGGRQEINLAQWCIDQFGTVLHELYHCLGFYHEQARPDRDNYVEIVWDNIIEDEKYNFECYGPDVVGTFGEEYDYKSIMHYLPDMFAIDKKEYTIKTKDPKYQDVIGKSEELSDTDLRKLLKMYNCPNVDS